MSQSVRLERVWTGDVLEVATAETLVGEGHGAIGIVLT